MIFSKMDAPTGNLSQARAAGERRAAGQPLRIVVADDERGIVDTLAGVLRDAGHDVYGIYNGAEVLPTVRIVRPDAVIVDILLPAMSGYAIAQELRHTFTDLRRPLLIGMSGKWKERSDRLIAQQVGFDHYLEKPCEAEEILKLLEPLANRPDRRS
jgi:DNA-binding response OmpR family regulator